MLILVTGATGYVGGRLVPLLIEAGHQVRCFVRDPRRLEGRPWGDYEIAQGSVEDEESLVRALEGCEAAYYLIHSMSGTVEDFEERDRCYAQTFARAAARCASLKRIVYLGGLGGNANGDKEMSAHLRSRQEVGSLLVESGKLVTEFRAAVIVGSGSASFEMIRYLTERLPVMICPRWVRTRCQPIAIRDVLHYLVDTLKVEASAGRIIEIGGQDVLTYADVMRGYAHVRRLRRWLIMVPVLTPRLSSYWVDFVTPLPAALARPLIEGLRTEVVVRDRSGMLKRLAADGQDSSWFDAYYFGLSRHQQQDVLVENEGMIVERRTQESAASPERAFDQVKRLGGPEGWLYADALWSLRGAIDHLFGGPGMRRGRRSLSDLRVGDALDFWRVEEIRPPELLRLRAEMRVPGRAWLQFEVCPDEKGGSTITQTAFFEPHGLAGWLYWYPLYPIHRLIFAGLLRKVAQRAEAAKSEDKVAS
jgi:uncharacterized protein YbjT (DUF2867 family)